MFPSVTNFLLYYSLFYLCFGILISIVYFYQTNHLFFYNAYFLLYFLLFFLFLQYFHRIHSRILYNSFLVLYLGLLYFYMLRYPKGFTFGTLLLCLFVAYLQQIELYFVLLFLIFLSIGFYLWKRTEWKGMFFPLLLVLGYTSGLHSGFQLFVHPE